MPDDNWLDAIQQPVQTVVQFRPRDERGNEILAPDIEGPSEYGFFNEAGERDHFASAPPSRTGPIILHGQPKAERASRFRSAAQLDGKPVPERVWTVRDLVPGRNVTILGGDGGTGKSLLAAQLACAVAGGWQWIGRDVAHGSAVYLSAEDDDDELHRRFADIVAAEGRTLADLDRLTYRSLAGEDALLALADGGKAPLMPSSLYTELDGLLSDLRPVLLVLDTLADLFPGNENDRAQARQFVGLLRGLALRHDCALVLLSHPSLSGLDSGSGTSGSTGWNNSVRSRLYFQRIAADGIAANPDARILRTMKANYGRTGGEINLTWRNGVFAADEVETGLDRKARNSKAERVFLKLLTEFQEQGRGVNHAGGPTYAPKMMAGNPRSEGVTQPAFRAAMDALITSGRVKIVTSGPPSKRRQHLEVCND